MGRDWPVNSPLRSSSVVYILKGGLGTINATGSVIPSYPGQAKGPKIPVAMATSGDRSVKLDFNNFRVADDAGGGGDLGLHKGVIADWSGVSGDWRYLANTQGT